MLTRIRSLFNRSSNPQTPPQGTPPVVHGRGQGLDVYPGEEEPGDYAITRYPPFDKGIPIIPVEKILHAQQDLLDRIFRTAGVSREDFDKLYMPAVRNLARHVHLLPATSTTYFRGTGGLFRMSLEIALNSLQSANAAVFPASGGVERRFFMQPKWTLAAFLAGLCCQNYRTVNSMAVMTRDNQQWTPLLEALYDWTVKTKSDVYFVRWMDDSHLNGAQASAAYSISQVVPPAVLQYLASDNNQVVPAMTAAIAGVQSSMSANPIGRLVAPVITRVIEDDLKRSSTNYGHLVIGAHLEMHLVDAMRRLVRGGKWIANNVASGGRLWVGKEGVFIDWPHAALDIANLLTRDSFAGIPQDPDTLADLLVTANLLQNNSRNTRYWTIMLPGSCEAKEGMVKLKEGEVIFPQGFDFSAYQNIELTLVTPSNKQSQPAGSAQASGSEQPETKLPVQKNQESRTEKENTQVQANKKPSGQQKVRRKQDTSSTPQSNQGDEVSKQLEIPETSPRVATDNAHAGRASNSQQSGSEEPAQPLPNAAPTGQPKENSSEIGEQFGDHIGPAAAKLLGSLKRGNAWLLSEVIQGYRNGTLTGVCVALPYGFAISHEELNAHGISLMELLEELGMKSWLWQDKTRASRRIHPIEIDGKQLRMMVLKHDIASTLGFDTTVKE